MPPHKLRLKPGAVIMLLRNLVPSKGLCNGTRLTVTRLQRNITEARVIDLHNSETILIPNIPFIPSDTNRSFQFQRRRFPVRLAFSITINKSQRQTFDKICLQKPILSHGHSDVCSSLESKIIQISNDFVRKSLYQKLCL